MPKINVSRSTTIQADAASVYSTLNDFNHWPKWSPWLIMEPDTQVTIADDAKYYEWNGTRTGEGNMAIIGEEQDKHIEYDLTFLKPWKSKAKVAFHLKEEGNNTHVTWTMDSSLPFFMFWMKKMMEGFVGMDYQRGLHLLKDYVEKGEVESKLEFKGVEAFPGMKYVGIKKTCAMDDIGTEMSADFEELNTYFDSAGIEIAGAFSIYHDWNMRKMQCTYTACLGVTSAIDTLPANMFNGSIPATNIHIVRHVGAYTHIGGAWSAQMNMQRGKEFATKKGIDPFEWYHNMPGEVPDKELITDICFAAK